jgi:phospholipid/cholesterol/gamma-HCH transport system permease protein
LNSEPALNIFREDGAMDLRPSGSWTTVHASVLERLCKTVQPEVSRTGKVNIDLSRVDELDTLGAWLLEKISRDIPQPDHSVNLTGVSDRYAELVAKVRQVNRRQSAVSPRRNPIVDYLEQFGRYAAGGVEDVATFLRMLGGLGISVFGILRRPRSLRLTSLAYQIYRVGWQAIPIIVLITFLIGAIIAQQGIFHFRKFGAESYVVDMVGILVLRELGVLIVAIMVAGRSGSAYTAELGSMKMREEIDALSTMDLDPVEVLVLPRILALVCALPILAFIGSMAALYGGGLIAWLYGGMSPAIFIARLHDAVSVTSFQVGMIKAPFMALAIGIVACSEGLQVKGSAESLGRQTTTSVVKSIFLVIVLDGVFAVFFASIGM